MSSHGVVAVAVASTIGAGDSSAGAAEKQVHESYNFLLDLHYSLKMSSRKNVI